MTDSNLPHLLIDNKAMSNSIFHRLIKLCSVPLVHSIDCFIVVPASLHFKLCTMTFASQEEGEGGVPVELFSDPHGVHRDSLEMWLDFLGHYPRSPQLLINKDHPIIVGLEQVRWC